VLEVEETRDPSVSHECVAEREVAVRDLLRERRVDQRRELGAPLETAAKGVPAVPLEPGLRDRLVEIVGERMNAGEVALEDRRAMRELAQRGERDVELRERGGGPGQVRPAVLRERLAGYAREEHREAPVDDPQGVAVVAWQGARHGEGELGGGELLQELVLEALACRIDDVGVHAENELPAGARYEERRVLVAALGLRRDPWPREAPGVEDRFDSGGRIHGCEPRSRRLRSSVSSWKVECSMSKLEERHRQR